MTSYVLTRGIAVIALAILGLILVSPAFAVDTFIKDKEEGWFWYQREPEPPEPKPVPKRVVPPPAAPTPPKKAEPPKPSALSVEWFQKEYPQILNAAIDDPTAENVQKYRYATRVMLDKASNFTHVFQRQSLLDPLLDESIRTPFSSAARGSFQALTDRERTEAVNSINKAAGLWVFLDDKCPFCALQYPLVSRTAKERGFMVTYITPDGKRPSWMSPRDELLADSGQSKYLRIGVRPAVALVIPPAKITVLTQGMLSQDLLEERILHAGDEAGLLSADLRKKAFPNERGLLTPDDIKEIGMDLDSNPNGLTTNVQQRIEKRF
ncbi:conjugal transfer protein TraF [Acidovorax sp. sic0104]|uniref:conjugal transfer protein TraF n=1 Tax=Acidovorax sp. sic0104 TaxID=2854784 RepID=UPI001C4596CD|nr:conjugal transfer protein TraF [Acidovorax sp. sic0104]MBV7542113.1 conjugal transfer protein TraF [Acidovorax sp. sic0104]